MEIYMFSLFLEYGVKSKHLTNLQPNKYIKVEIKALIFCFWLNFNMYLIFEAS